MNEQRLSSVPVIELPSSGSERTSKSTSPVRSVRNTSVAESGNTRHSNSNASPTRASSGAPSVPSAAAVQRALMVTRATSVGGESASDTIKERKQRSTQNTPQWPVSPRLKSPPPVSLRSISGRITDAEHSQLNSSIRRLAPVSSTDSGAAMLIPQDTSKDSTITQSTIRAPGRSITTSGTSLATVNEASVPSVAPISSAPRNDEDGKSQIVTEEQDDVVAEPSTIKAPASTTAVETSTKPVPEKAETTPTSRATSTSRAQTHLNRRSLTGLTGKGKPAIEPLRTMTVETETVSSTPQVIPDRGRDGGSIRTRPSVETIRPKKEKKKPSRKTPSLHTGTNSSKADIFEAKVASAVGEADSTDSDETFVYESNPPESRHTRHHSRTPSATSLASQLDQHSTRGKHGLRSNSTAAGGKKSMKFSNSIYGAPVEGESATDGRSSMRTTSSTPRHHHIGRYGRVGPPSVIDTTSPFPESIRPTSPRTPNARNSRPSSPRTSNGRLHFSRKAAAAGYDAYDDAADDERAPLMNSVRVSRNRHSRRPNSSQFRPLHFVEDEDTTCWPRFSGVFCLGSLITLICAFIVVFIVFLNRTLIDIEIVRIENVLASEQELMLDMLVRATNPNLFPIIVNHLDISLFAESPYVGTSVRYMPQPRYGRLSPAERRGEASLSQGRTPFWFPPFGSDDGVDKGTDPIDDPDLNDPDFDPGLGNRKMLLGYVYNFDSPLTFEPTPFNPHYSSSLGSIRLHEPGEKAEIGGSERWARVLQHPFELIVRGVIIYQLPLSSSTRSAQIGGRISVSPDGDSDDDGNIMFTASWSKL